jgi:formylglycine-generating enzyme required for sulfatase activity
LDDTTPVDIFPGGASPYGVLDMAGNVCEWTCSAYKEYPHDPSDGREDLEAGDDVDRALRGGSWYHSADAVRCGRRDWDSPRDWLNNLGFRVVVSPGFPL